MDIDSYWEYSDPAGSEARFRAALAIAHGDAALELQTQIARTYSLRRRFADAHRVLDDIAPQLSSAGRVARVRALLERGRTFNSSGDSARAQPLFVDAWTLAEEQHLEGLAVDAAHMLAIVTAGDEAAQWTRRGLDVARNSSDPKARALLPALLNNHAWSLHDSGDFAGALPVFREAESASLATGRQPQGRIATWSVARCLRSLGRYEEALSLQRRLEQQWAATGQSDGYVFEEIAELFEALGRTAEARSYFARAAAELAKDPWFVEKEAARLARLRARAGTS
jgi:tetratricopeptide (TPR) repeat protein